jgi:hypothetical protein
MVLHLGHLVHNPSGISRLRDLAPPSFGFLAKLVFLDWAGGGVTAGSTVSKPRVFLVKEVVVIFDLVEGFKTEFSQCDRKSIRWVPGGSFRDNSHLFS